LLVRRLLALFVTALPALALACSEPAANEVTKDDDLLPNGSVYELDHDGMGYRMIAEYFGERGLDLRVDTSAFAPIWPVRGGKTSVLDRVGTPIYLGQSGYYHTAFDILATPAPNGREVIAPHAGLALVFDWSGRRATPNNPYRSVVAIYDPVSHIVTQLMHVKPTAALAAATEPVRIARGDVVGEITMAPIGAEDAARLSHAHVNFIDGATNTILDPARLFPDYHDSVAPQPKRLYVADEAARAGNTLVSGKIDLVLEAFDRDDDSNRNLELGAIAYTIQDPRGEVIASLPRCSLSHLYESVAAPASFRAKELIDFGSASSQISGGWPNSDIDNPERTFRYALTQLAVENGRCKVLDDVAGHLEIGDDVEELVVRVTLWDPKGNQTVLWSTLSR
jgi:hypothetical protein